jgi:hypothetical protein
LWTPDGQEPDYESKEIPCPAYNSGPSVRKFSKIFFNFYNSIFMINLMLPVCGKFGHINQSEWLDESATEFTVNFQKTEQKRDRNCIAPVV